MTDDKKLKEDQDQAMADSYRDTFLTDALLRITAIENLLMQKGLISEEEIRQEIHTLSTVITKAISDKLDTLDITSTEEIQKWVNEFNVVNNKPDKNSN